MVKARLKNDGLHDVLVYGGNETVSIRQHGRDPGTIVVSLSVVPMLIAALQEAARG